MKRIFIIVIGLIAVWFVTVQYFKRTEPADSKMIVTDSSQAKASMPLDDSAAPILPTADTLRQNRLALPKGSINTKDVRPQELVAFAKTQIGVPYLYGSTEPSKGFDCSGFITYVFKHFGIIVPRSSIDFTHVGREVDVTSAKEGDLILFTGTDSTERFVGHMGIVVDNSDSLRFIHSTSGRKYGVTITAFGDYYRSRFVKTIRVFP